MSADQINEGWIPSKTGGTVIGAPKAAELLGVSHNHFLAIFLKMGLYPSTEYSPLRKRQTLRFYLADVERIKANPREARAAIDRYNVEISSEYEGKKTGNPSAA